MKETKQSAKLKIGSKILVENALREVETLENSEVKHLKDADKILMVDIRDPRELEREGKIEGAFHCPRGLIEFWIDPESEYFHKKFNTDKKIVLFCAMGWRSALAAKTLKDMGVENSAHMEGGFKGWKEAGFPVQTVTEN